MAHFEASASYVKYQLFQRFFNLCQMKLEHQIREFTLFKTRQTVASWSGVGEAAAAGLTRVAHASFS